MEFKNITKIIGPGGKEVSKITRTSDNVILWQQGYGSGMIITTDGKYNENTSVPLSISGGELFHYYVENSGSATIKNCHYFKYSGYQDDSGSWMPIFFKFNDITQFAGKTIHIDAIMKLTQPQQTIGLVCYRGNDKYYYQENKMQYSYNVLAKNISFTIPTDVIKEYDGHPRDAYIFFGAITGAEYYVKGLYIS